jgi:hypothetical protein
MRPVKENSAAYSSHTPSRQLDANNPTQNVRMVYKGNYPFVELTHQTFYNLVLDDLMPWENVQITPADPTRGNFSGPIIHLPMFSIPSCITRDFFLSAAVTIIHKAGQAKRSRVEIIGLAALAGYGNAFDRYYWSGMDCLEQAEPKPKPNEFVEAMLESMFSHRDDIVVAMLGKFQYKRNARSCRSISKKITK